MTKDTKFLLLAGGVILLVYFIGKKKASAAGAGVTPSAVVGDNNSAMTPHPTKSDGTPEDPHLESWMLYHYGQSAKPSDKLWSDPFAQPTEDTMSQEDFLASRL